MCLGSVAMTGRTSQIGKMRIFRRKTTKRRKSPRERPLASTIQIGTRIVFLNLIDGLDGADLGLSEVTMHLCCRVPIWDSSDPVHLSRSAIDDDFTLAVLSVGSNNDNEPWPCK